MSKRYVLREGLSMAMVPGAGKVTRGMYLTGEYDRFVPTLLVEVLDSMPPPPPPARVLTEPKMETAAPAPEEAPAPKPELLTETLPVEEEVLAEEESNKKRPRRKRKGLFSEE